MDIPLNTAARRQPRSPAIQAPLHLNVLIASMSIGGAERCVHDILLGLRGRRPGGKLFLLHEVAQSYTPEVREEFPVLRLGGLERTERMRAVALEVLTSPSPVLFTHLVRASDLRSLWELGVTTIPVIHNSAPGWQDPPSAYENERVPFLVAVSDDVRAQLVAAGCRRPIQVLRHELQRWRTAEEAARDRAEIRRRHGIGPDTVLIGMVGQFKAQKAYPRAVKVLREVRKFADARLMILGGWEHGHDGSRAAYTATMKAALDLGVLTEMIVPGPVQPVEPYYAAFDLFLNTSSYEGLSIATLEAAQTGCPMVLSAVGGQREAAPASAVLIKNPANIQAYVRAIRGLLPLSKTRSVVPPPAARDLIPRLWCWLAHYGVVLPTPPSPVADTLFITSNLNAGGAQRSLTNLLTQMAGQHRSWLCVLSRVLGDHFLTNLESAGVPVVGLAAGATMLDRTEQVLELIARLGVRTVCFWNVEASLKLLLAKVFAARELRLIDVSPGPMLFVELDGAADLQRRLAFTGADYLRRLDCFVAKYRGGEPPASYGAGPRQVEVISNGVPVCETSAPLEPSVRPASVDPALAVVTCCRIVPDKRIEELLEMWALLMAQLPEASLTIVGGVDQRHIGYAESLDLRRTELGLTNVHFAGPNADASSFLGEFQVFVMMSRAQGCPNASLEAMAAGLPVVANADGGTGEQVVHGRTGYLVSGDDPAEMASRVASLLRAPERARHFGEAGRRRARRLFSMERMVAAYLRLLREPDA